MVTSRGGSRIFEKGGGGSILGLQAKKGGGGSKRGSNFGPNVKKPTSWPKRVQGVQSGPPGPPPPWIRYWPPRWCRPPLYPEPSQWNAKLANKWKPTWGLDSAWLADYRHLQGTSNPLGGFWIKPKNCMQTLLDFTQTRWCRNRGMGEHGGHVPQLRKWGGGQSMICPPPHFSV